MCGGLGLGRQRPAGNDEVDRQRGAAEEVDQQVQPLALVAGGGKQEGGAAGGEAELGAQRRPGGVIGQERSVRRPPAGDSRRIFAAGMPWKRCTSSAMRCEWATITAEFVRWACSSAIFQRSLRRSAWSMACRKPGCVLPQIAMSAAPVWLQAISGNRPWRRLSARMRRSKTRSRSLPGTQDTFTRSGSTQPYSGSDASKALAITTGLTPAACRPRTTVSA